MPTLLYQATGCETSAAAKSLRAAGAVVESFVLLIIISKDILTQQLIQPLQQQIGIGIAEWHRRADLDHIVVWAVGAGQDPALAQPVDQVARLISRRRKRSSI